MIKTTVVNTIKMIMIILNFANVVCRVLLPQTPFSYSEELTLILFVWSTMFGISYAYREKAHTGLSLIVDHLPKAAKIPMFIFAAVCTVFLSYFMVTTGMAMVNNQIQFHRVTSGMRIPEAACGISIPAGGIMIAIRGVQTAYNSIKALGKEEVAQ